MNRILCLCVIVVWNFSCAPSDPPVPLTPDQKARLENLLTSASRINKAVDRGVDLKQTSHRNESTWDEETRKMGDLLGKGTCTLTYPQFLETIDATLGNFQVNATGEICAVNIQLVSDLTKTERGGNLSWKFSALSDEFKKLSDIQSADFSATLRLSVRKSSSHMRVDGVFRGKGTFNSRIEGSVGVTMEGDGFVEGNGDTDQSERSTHTHLSPQKNRTDVNLRMTYVFSDFKVVLEASGDVLEAADSPATFRLNGEVISKEEYNRIFNQGLLFWM